MIRGKKAIGPLITICHNNLINALLLILCVYVFYLPKYPIPNIISFILCTMLIDTGSEKNILLFADGSQYVFRADQQTTSSRIANAILVRLGCVELSKSTAHLIFNHTCLSYKK